MHENALSYFFGEERKDIPAPYLIISFSRGWASILSPCAPELDLCQRDYITVYTNKYRSLYQLYVCRMRRLKQFSKFNRCY